MHLSDQYKVPITSSYKTKDSELFLKCLLETQQGKWETNILWYSDKQALSKLFEPYNMTLL